ncbi:MULTISPECIES: carbohydrate ABC transporter permease [Cellulomonas]|uniref:Binding-protein-dependent transport systems inner membrane component n=1 Tax=Cellulomonas gilvus (strain ATCC 13127 / NRRL B-14078) TaxID=593907 RepID=F8A1Y4_CELGA|nr:MULTISPECIES: carbohydrate ABC transporter permease [Cellulomonas]AEI12928.1 binding-protein-dependent transport systems inner membrane component [Cellulomonas gilvus ATCC 13127]MCR6689320.1 carbohydrate ABC transporter permease [Cellulomonas sp.]
MTRAITSTVKYTSLVLASIMMLLPIGLIVMGSFKTTQEFLATGPFTPPEDWTNVDNYVKAFDQGGMLMGFVNTVIIFAAAIAGTILIGAATAYALDRFRFPGRRAVLNLFLLATLVPGVTTQVATFQIINGLGLYDTRGALILLFMGTDIISIYIFLQFMRSIPRSLDEAATIDGAGHLRIFFTIILPNLKPAIATVIIIKGIGIYNEFFLPFLYIADPDKRPISTALFAFKGPFGAFWEVISAGVIITIIPILVLFLFLQRYIYNGFTSGATK